MSDRIELDAVARRVIAEGRLAYEPSELVNARVRRAVEGRLSAGAALPNAYAGALAQGWVKILVGAAAASVVTAAFAYAAWRKDPPVPRADSIPSVPAIANTPPGYMTPAPVATELVPAPVSASAEVAAESTRAEARTRAAVSSKSENLADEVRLLASVNSAIQRHDAAEAQRLLRTYDRQFKNPVLRQERAAAGVLALCAAGRGEQARLAGKRFLSAWPNSPLAARVAESCMASK